MADSLARILQQLQASDPTVGDQPITATAAAFEDMAAEGAKKLHDSERENALAATVLSWYSACKSARSFEEQQWYKNLDMYQGRQFTQWNAQQQRMIDTPNPAGEPRTVVNLIEPLVRTEMAKTGSTHPSANVAPASDDQADLMAAMAAEYAWEWYYDSIDFHTSVFTPANFWRTVCGNGFGKTYWDQGAVDPAAQDAAQRQMAAQVAEQAQMGANVAAVPPAAPVLGQIRSKPVTPFHLFVPDLTELALQDQPYLIHAYTMPLAKAQLTYGPVMGKDWIPSTTRADSIMDVSHVGLTSDNSAAKDAVMVYEAWVKPGQTSQLPSGGLVVVVDKRVVGFVDRFPYDHGMYPFFHLPGVETGRFYRKSVVETVIPLQDQTNRSVNQLLKNRNMITRPQHYYDEGSVDPTRIRPIAGQYIPVKLGMKDPRPVQHAPLPAWVLNFTELLDGYRDDISGQHQVSRATSPGADTAASAVSLLRESDDDFLVTVFDGIRVAMTQTARQVIALMIQFWTEPRLVKVVGAEEAADAHILTGADLTGGSDIKIDGDSMLPQSKTAKIATITDWMDKGYLPVDVGMDVLEMGQLGKAYKTLKVDKNQARRENVQLGKADLAAVQQHQAQAAQLAQEQAVVQQAEFAAAGAGAADQGLQPPAPAQPEPFLPINWYDNDEVHVNEHKQFAKSQEFASWDPALQEELRLHVVAHEQRLAEAQLQAQEQLAQEQQTDPVTGEPQASPGTQRRVAGAKPAQWIR